MNENINKISGLLKGKGNLKQEVYAVTLDRFEHLKSKLIVTVEQLNEKKDSNDKFDVEYKANGKFEARIKFAGDELIFNMHSNVFGFEAESYVHSLNYVKQDPNNQFCGMIEIYNFLADSFKYSRVYDVGYLIARIFINKDGHFYVEGEEQLGFLYKQFDKMILTDEIISLIIENAMLYSIDFDLWVPKYAEVKQLTVGQKMQQNGNITHKTGKRVGFEFANLNKTIE
ncbi:MAG: hypothetical protein ACI8ZX_001453 [Planctomycetota bacterium]|jgi:hypothetical protein